MGSDYARGRINAKAERTAARNESLVVVVLADAAVHRGAGDDVDSVRQKVDDDCAGGIVRFSLGSHGH